MNDGGHEGAKDLLHQIRSESTSQDELIANWKRRGPNLSEEERLSAFDAMVEADFWLWLPVICQALEAEVGGSRFMPMISKLSGRINEKLAGEIFWSGLIDGAERMPREAISQSDELLEDGSEISAIFSSALLAGAARREPERVMGILSDLLASPSTSRRSAALRTMNIALNELTLSGEGVLDIVLSNPIPKEAGLRSSYSMTLRLLHEFDTEATESRFRELLRSSPDWVRMQVIYDLSVIGDISEETKALLDEYSRPG
jgi:hypothetical protein